jgi:hypothetical protein
MSVCGISAPALRCRSAGFACACCTAGARLERLRVRNDDSVVLEVLFGDVAILLPATSARRSSALVPLMPRACAR